jgi:Ca2+/Na+ antiporter
MMSQIQMFPRTPGMLLLLGALVAWYVSSRACVEALAPRADAPVARRAIAYWLPIAALVLLATLVGRPDLAVTTIFGTCVASLSLVLGLVSFAAGNEAPPPNLRGPWSMVAPVAIILLLAGFAGHFDWFRAAVLPLYGLVTLYVWLEQPRGAHSQARGVSTPLDFFKLVQLALAVALAFIGAWAALNAAEVMGSVAQFFTGTFLGAALIGPALVLPIIGNATEIAHRQHHRAIAALVLMVLLNLCFLLPVTIALALLSSALSPLMGHALPSMSAVLAALQNVEPVPYPLATWRVDTIFLIILGFMLIPLAAGRWTIGRGEALVLVLAYAVYLAMQAQHAIR